MSFALFSAALVTPLVAADPELTAVALDNPILVAEGTYISPGAQAAIAGGADTPVHCLDLPEGSASHAVACLDTAEWQQVFARIDSREASGRAHAQAQRFADNRTTAVTP
ncbi:MAG: hypothetical protein WBA68_01920 [Alteraurantiacibacter sp.]